MYRLRHETLQKKKTKSLVINHFKRLRSGRCGGKKKNRGGRIKTPLPKALILGGQTGRLSAKVTSPGAFKKLLGWVGKEKERPVQLIAPEFFPGLIE